MYQRLYSDKSLLCDDTISFDSEYVHYIAHVLRLKGGDFLYLFDGIHGEFLSEIISLKKKEILLKVIKKTKNYIPLKKLKLVFSLIKQDRLNMMIEKATELGVTHFQPIYTEYTQIRKVNLKRLQKIAIEASEQSERLDIPTFYELISLNQYVEEARDNVLLCCERFENHQKMESQKKDTVLIGPEGGFSEKEKEYLLKKMMPISLGKTILRAETAAIVALDRIRI